MMKWNLQYKTVREMCGRHASCAPLVRLATDELEKHAIEPAML